MTMRALLFATTALSVFACVELRAQPAPAPAPSATEDQKHPPGKKEPAKQQPPAAHTPPKQPPAAAAPPLPGPAPAHPSTAQEKQPLPKKETAQPPAAPAKPAQTQPAQGGAPAHPPAAQAPQKQPQQPAQAHPQPPAAQSHPPAPAAQGQPSQPPAAQTRPAQPQPPAAQSQPAQPQPPAAQTQPAQPQPPAAQAQPGQAPAPAAQNPPPKPLPPAAQGQAAPGTNARRMDELRGERHEMREGNRTVIQEADRTIIREGGQTIIRHNEWDRFRYGARDVRTERQGNETVTVIERPDGSRIVTVTDANGRLLRRMRRDPAGHEVVIIDNRGPATASYFVELPPPVIQIPRERYILEAEHASEADIYAVLIAPPVERLTRRYTLDEIRYSPQVRDRMPRVDLDTINFDSGSWEVAPDQAARLSMIAAAIKRATAKNPSEVFLIEGHTDAVGSDIDNLSLSDRRAESVALVLTEQFQVPAENLTTQGYGEQYLKINTQAAERQNRRVTARRITPLLTGGQPSPGG